MPPNPTSALGPLPPMGGNVLSQIQVLLGAINRLMGALSGRTTTNIVILGTVTITGKYIELSEMTAPAAPGANGGRLFLQDNGAGKTQLCIIFNTGAAQVIATQP